MPVFRRGTFALERVRCDLASPYTLDVAAGGTVAEVSVTGTLTYGEVYSAGATGIRWVLKNTHDETMVPKDHHYLTITWPTAWGGGSYSWTHTGYLATVFDILLIFTNITLIVNSDCTASLEFDQLDIYIDEGSGPGLEVTIGHQLVTIAAYDKRENTLEIETTDFTSPFSLPSSGSIACAATYAAQPTRNDAAAANVVCGWKHSADGATWLEQVSAWYRDRGFPAVTGCHCPQAPPIPTDASSYSIGISSNELRLITKQSLPDFVYCGGLVTLSHHDSDDHGREVTTHARLYADNDGITDLYIESSTTCEGVTVTDAPATISTARTYNELWLTVSDAADHVDCYNIISGACPDPDAVGPMNAETYCKFLGSLSMVHPTLPGCAGDQWPWYDVSFSMRHLRGFVRDGTAWVGRSDNGGAAWDDVDSGIACVKAIGRIDRQVKDSPLYLWVEAGGTISRYSSPDEGKTFGMATTLLTATTPATFAGRHGTQYTYGLVADAGLWKVRGTILDRTGNVMVAAFDTGITGVDNAGLAVDEFVTSGGKHQIRIWAVVSGAITSYLSDEGQVFV